MAIPNKSLHCIAVALNFCSCAVVDLVRYRQLTGEPLDRDRERFRADRVIWHQLRAPMVGGNDHCRVEIPVSTWNASGLGADRPAAAISSAKRIRSASPSADCRCRMSSAWSYWHCFGDLIPERPPDCACLCHRRARGRGGVAKVSFQSWVQDGESRFEPFGDSQIENLPTGMFWSHVRHWQGAAFLT